MAATVINSYSDELEANLQPLYAPLKTNQQGGRVRMCAFRVTLASQAAGEDIALCIIPKGARLLSGVIVASAALANSAQVSIGLAGTDGSGELKPAGITALTTAGASSANAESDLVTALKAAAVLSTTQVPFLLTQALGYLYETQKEVYLTATTSVGTVATEVVTGHIFYVVD